MKKRMAIIAGGVALTAAAAAIPLGAAHGAAPPPPSRRCQVLDSQIFATEEQLLSLIEQPQTRLVRLQEQLLFARLSQLEKAAQASGCPPVIIIGP